MHSRQGIVGISFITSVRRSLQHKYEEDTRIRELIEELSKDQTINEDEAEVVRQAHREVSTRLYYTALLDGLWQEIHEVQQTLSELHVYDSLEREFSDAAAEDEFADAIHNVSLEDVDMNAWNEEAEDASALPIERPHGGVPKERSKDTLPVARDESAAPVVRDGERLPQLREAGAMQTRLAGTVAHSPALLTTVVPEEKATEPSVMQDETDVPSESALPVPSRAAALALLTQQMDGKALKKLAKQLKKAGHKAEKAEKKVKKDAKKAKRKAQRAEKKRIEK